MLLLIWAGCRFHGTDTPDDSTPTPDDTGDSATGPRTLHVAWGDLHAHSNLSHDGCEDPDTECAADEALPAELTFSRAEAYGLQFTAMTDHAEIATYERPDDAVSIDVWETTQDLIRAADEGPVFGIAGYEWTGNCSDDDSYVPSHRTVLLENTEVCDEWRIPSCHQVPADGSAGVIYGLEYYGYSLLDPARLPSDLDTRLREVPTSCGETRWIAFFHHPAQGRPAPLDWSTELTVIPGDTVVEIASEHGSSECDTRVATEGCDWRFNEDDYQDAGSIQYMLQQKDGDGALLHPLGFVGGTDNHMAEPGRLSGDLGYVRNIQDRDPDPAWHNQFSLGTVTGILSWDETIDRGDVFDALAARHTVVGSLPFTGLQIYGTGTDGNVYLPGDDVPTTAQPLVVTVTLDDPNVTEWEAELVDPLGQVSDPTYVEIPANDARYLRLRVWVDKEEHRVFASPWFGQ